MHEVEFRWERRPSGPAAENLRCVVNSVLNCMDSPPSEVHILVTDDRRIRDLNRQYRQIDEATDVLSFSDGTELPDGRVLLGQLVISRDRVRVQAERASHSEIRELEELTLHGVLHLLGYDHNEDQGEMDKTELKLRRDVLE
ncbi:MAG: rRNA maturation RNase YbeY [Acidobacteria bacterium]|nr:rRNA maturation RNase YbeY [Acidobacteriota bacterium]